MLRRNSDIKGIPIPDTDIAALFFQYADDTTLTVANVQSVNAAFNVCKLNCEGTGAEINMN